MVGSEMSGGVRNVSVSNCQFLGTDVGLRFKSKRGRGGIVENIWVRNVSMMDIPTNLLLSTCIMEVSRLLKCWKVVRKYR